METSSFGSEFIAVQRTVEFIQALHYKLHMFDIPIKGAINVYHDNGVSRVNTTQKKHTAINFHCVREAVASVILHVTKEEMDK